LFCLICLLFLALCCIFCQASLKPLSITPEFSFHHWQILRNLPASPVPSSAKPKPLRRLKLEPGTNSNWKVMQVQKDSYSICCCCRFMTFTLNIATVIFSEMLEVLQQITWFKSKRYRLQL
jgi:hypothetical protein